MQKIEYLAGWRLSVVKLKNRVGRGRSLIGFFQDFAVFAIGLKVFGWPLWILPAFALGGFVFFYLLGYADEVHGIWKTESVYGTKILNPWLEEKLEK